MTVDKDDAAASDAAQRAILRTQSGRIARLVGEKSELIAQLEGIQAECDEALRERDEALEASALFQRDVHKWRTRAEAAEARIAPDVTREDVDEAVKGTLDGWNITLPDNLFDAQIDAVWALVSGNDPAVFVVRESQIAAVEVEQAEDGYWEADGDLVAMRQNTAEALRGWALGNLQILARYEAVARAIEAGCDPVDGPVEEKARELYESANPGVSWGAMVESAGRGNKADGKVAREYRVIARHILGQEAGDE